ncbi:MAG: DNA-3-methyladenine glycosylase 2 family protein [Chloroflexi bacterium]|nr:DNA-3-methyladenine glycosylase 2 family protein [Chloroflexota bacterium]
MAATAFPDPPALSAAVAWLRARDPLLTAIIDSVGPPRLPRRPADFGGLVAAVLGQQLSIQAAAAIRQRVEAYFAGTLTPAAFLATDEATLRGLGISRGKVGTLRALAEAAASGYLRVDQLATQDDEAVVRQLSALPGIGRWTAEMFLIFSLGRLDIWPVDDLGLRAALARFYGLSPSAARSALVAFGERWRPYRTLATWYLWQGRRQRELRVPLPVDLPPASP